MKMLMVLMVSVISTGAFAIDLTPENPDITTPNCGAHAYIAPNTTIVIIEIPKGKCNRVRAYGMDVGATESIVNADGSLKVVIESSRSGLTTPVTLSNLDSYPFTIDKFKIVY